MLYKRSSYSKITDCINTQSVQIFNLMMEYPDDIYYLPKPNIAIIAKQNGNRLFLADIIATKPISFDALKQELPFANIEVVEFGFSPDWLGVTPTWIPSNMNEELLFVRGDWNLPTNFCFPATSET
jgi:hypothetical protein